MHKEIEREIERAANRRALVRTQGCHTLKAAALRALSHIQHILLLADARTLPTLQAVALGDLSFRPREKYMSADLKPPYALSTPRSHLSFFKTRAAMQAAREENACSMRLFGEVNRTRLQY